MKMHSLVHVLLFIGITAVMYYSAAAMISDAVKYACNLAVACWALLEIMFVPHWKRLRLSGSITLMYVAPFIAIILWSAVIWVTSLQSSSFVMRGSRNVFYMITNMLFVMSAFYLFKEKCTDYLLYGMALANALVFFSVGREMGFDRLINDLIRLILTFAADTGPAIKKMELHEVTFGFGAYVLYYLLQKKRGFTGWLNLGIAGFFFLTGFKRIGIIAVVLAFLYGKLYLKLGDGARKKCVLATALTLIIGSFTYLVLIKSRMFLSLVAGQGIDTMSRDWIFYVFDDFYEISPLFMGNGIRFVWQYGIENHMWNALHNVYLEFYIELGFFMYFFWMIYELWYRPHYVIKRYGSESAAYLVAGTVYIFISFFTDNTSFHLPINSIYRMLALVWLSGYVDISDTPEAHPKKRKALKE